jgi:hypothetical protein
LLGGRLMKNVYSFEKLGSISRNEKRKRFPKRTREEYLMVTARIAKGRP